MEKSVLNDYIDACAVIDEAEKKIRRIKKHKRIVTDKVSGSNPEFPYEPRSFKVTGSTETYENKISLEREEHILERQKKIAEELKNDVEEWMTEIPFRMQRIIEYKIFKRLSWDETAVIMKAKSGDSLRMEFNSFMKK